MVTANGEPSAKALALGLAVFKHQSTNGGSSDTDVNEFAVTPTGSPLGFQAVTTVTPVANVPKASRSARGLSGSFIIAFTIGPTQISFRYSPG